LLPSEIRSFSQRWTPSFHAIAVFEIADTCNDGQTLIEVVASRRLEFDIVVTGWNLSEMDAGKVLLEFRRRHLQTPVVL
jgi:DNA-binding response OmpR family regulator